MAHTVAGRFGYHGLSYKGGVPTENEYPDYRNSKISSDSLTINNASVKEKDNIKVKKNDDYER